MLKIAITGDIATGKSFVLKIFEKHGIPVYNADDEVKEIYQSDCDVIAKIAKIIPQSINKNSVDKQKLAQAVEQNPHILNSIERIVHKKIEENKKKFIQKNYLANCIVFEIPLLLETKQQNQYDLIIVTNADCKTKYKRFSERKFSNKQKWNAINLRQYSKVSKIVCADYIIDTSNGKDITLLQIECLIDKIKNSKRIMSQK